MKNWNIIKSLLYGGVTILLTNSIVQDDWGFVLYTAIAFVIGGLILSSLITFMSDNKKGEYYK